jgi:hypothetical protein
VLRVSVFPTVTLTNGSANPLLSIVGKSLPPIKYTTSHICAGDAKAADSSCDIDSGTMLARINASMSANSDGLDALAARRPAATRPVRRCSVGLPHVLLITCLTACGRDLVALFGDDDDVVVVEDDDDDDDDEGVLLLSRHRATSSCVYMCVCACVFVCLCVYV